MDDRQSDKETDSMSRTIDTTAYSKHFSEENLNRKIAEAKGLGRTLLIKVFELWYAFRSHYTPAWAKAVIVGALGYFIFPVDVIFDYIPVAGFLDDAGVIASALTTIAMYVTDDVKAKAEKAVEDLLG